MILIPFTILVACLRFVAGNSDEATLDPQVCANCEYNTGGIGYLPTEDCYSFYQCRKDENGEIAVDLLCCQEGTEWNQDIFNCDWTETCVDPRPEYCLHKVYEDVPCRLIRVPEDKTMYLEELFGVYLARDCPAGTVFAEEKCGCVHGGTYGKTCSSDPLLHFPFTSHPNDVQCIKAQGILNGDAHVNEDEGYLNLDGDEDFLILGYLNNWFNRNSPPYFMLSMWFYQTEAGYNRSVESYEGLYGDGDCLHYSHTSILLSQEIAMGGLFTLNETAGGPPKGPNAYFGRANEPDSEDRLYGPAGKWNHVGMRYSEPDNEVAYFLNGELVGTRETRGPVLAGKTSSTIGMIYFSCVPYFFTGFIDDFMFFDRFVSDYEILQCVYGNGRTGPGADQAYECTVV